MASEQDLPTNRFDVIVVGAGPAGLAAAKACAEEGLDTIVIERGTAPGTKNVMGGVLYTQPTARAFPDFWKEAPVERCVVHQEVWALTADSAVRIGYRSHRFCGTPPTAFTVFRVRLDKHFAQKVEEAGALIICETKAEEVLRDGGKVVGVRVGREQGEVYAPIVILAEGVNARLALALGMQTKLQPRDVATIVKEVIALDRKVIEDRFQLTGDQGATIEMYGDSTMGKLGAAFLYTNRDTLSLGVGLVLAEKARTKLTPHDLMQRLKEHPLIAPLIAGGRTAEYLSHLIPEGGYRRIPKLFADGVMIAGDAAMLVNSLHREGANHAFLSGRLAGETAVEAHRAGDFSARMLSRYRERLWHDAPTLRDLRKYRNASRFIETHPAALTVYPEIASAALYEMLTVGGATKREMQWRVIRHAIAKRGFWGLIRDAIAGGRSMW